MKKLTLSLVFCFITAAAFSCWWCIANNCDYCIGDDPSIENNNEQFEEDETGSSGCQLPQPCCKQVNFSFPESVNTTGQVCIQLPCCDCAPIASGYHYPVDGTTTIGASVSTSMNISPAGGCSVAVAAHVAHTVSIAGTNFFTDYFTQHLMVRFPLHCCQSLQN